MSDTQPDRTLGSTILKRGYLNDSLGLKIDENAVYLYEASQGVLTALWRYGLSRPRDLKPIRKA